MVLLLSLRMSLTKDRRIIRPVLLRIRVTIDGVAADFSCDIQTYTNKFFYSSKHWREVLRRENIPPVSQTYGLGTMACEVLLHSTAHVSVCLVH